MSLSRGRTPPAVAPHRPAPRPLRRGAVRPGVFLRGLIKRALGICYQTEHRVFLISHKKSASYLSRIRMSSSVECPSHPPARLPNWCAALLYEECTSKTSATLTLIIIPIIIFILLIIPDRRHPACRPADSRHPAPSGTPPGSRTGAAAPAARRRQPSATRIRDALLAPGEPLDGALDRLRTLYRSPSLPRPYPRPTPPPTPPYPPSIPS